MLRWPEKYREDARCMKFTTMHDCAQSKHAKFSQRDDLLPEIGTDPQFLLWNLGSTPITSERLVAQARNCFFRGPDCVGHEPEVDQCCQVAIAFRDLCRCGCIFDDSDLETLFQ